MGSQDILALAKQGNPSAIASLINQVTNPKGITAHVDLHGSCLQILLVADRLPNRTVSTRFIYNGLLRLQIPFVESVQIYGRQSNRPNPDWSEVVQLNQPLPSTIPTIPPKSQPLLSRLASKIPLIAMGGICWLLIAAGGFALRTQLDSPSTTKKPSVAQKSLSAPKTAASPVKIPSIAKTPPSTPKPTPAATENIAIAIKAVGDTIPGTNFPSDRLPSDPKILFQAIKPTLQGADILFANFESTLTNHPKSAKDTRQRLTFAFRTPPVYAKLLKEVGFNVLSVANNHSMDFFEKGFEDTIANIEANGMKAVGKKDQIVYLKVKNTSVAFIGFSYLDAHNSMQDLEAVKTLLAEANAQADVVVISVHAGAEGTGAMHVNNKIEIFFGENRGNSVLFARTAIDNGADLVLGHGPHVPRAMELYKGKLIAYSLGNFMGYNTLSSEGETGYSLILEVKVDQKGNFMNGKIIPVHIRRPGIPYPDNQPRSIELIRNLTKADFPNTPLKIDERGNLSKTSQ